MNKYFMILVVMCSCMTTNLLSAVNLHLQKNAVIMKQPKHHPMEQVLMQGNAATVKHGRDAHEKLLVLLVDFTREAPDDPNTTGNGSFLLEADPNYEITIAAPPHDRRYYEANLEALRLYYQAASLGSFNLSYDVWPHQASAYTLPHSMGYYNPPNASSSLFLSRMEEYFKESFETADSLDPAIDFSQYDHFMIIHAGSDWQHDVLGDTPSDIPSFFIRVSEGKEAIVDDGAVQITHACNVPEMITQDIQVSQSDSLSYISGYGALNGVYAHEFGHSMGLVDLYNVRTFQPEVGVFDIMDSGGGIQMVFPGDDNKFYAIEGILPTLPGAWSRVKMFETDFRQRHILEDASDLGFGPQISLKAAESKYELNYQYPYFIKIPLSTTEYVLLENRSVDPDGDGGTYFIGIDPDDPGNHDSPNKRVILAPTPPADNLYTPSYEYDYLLPSWVGKLPNVYFDDRPTIGGGVLAWHIDDNIIYEQGTTTDGVFSSNYTNNTVNAIHSKRGVKIIEADDLPDIGNQYSYFWTGTSYEYFFKYRPILDENGYFTGWSSIPWKDELSSQTHPALTTNQHTPSIYSIGINSNPTNYMSVEISSTSWSGLSLLGQYDGLQAIGPIVNAEVFPFNLPIICSDSLLYLSHEYQPAEYLDNWQNLYGTMQQDLSPISSPVVSADADQDGIGEMYFASNNDLVYIESLDYYHLAIPDAGITDAPLIVGGNCLIPGSDHLYSYTSMLESQPVLLQQLEIPGARMIGDSTGVYALSGHTLYTLNRGTNLDWNITRTTGFEETFTSFEPVGFRDSDTSKPAVVFLLSDEGNLYRYAAGNVNLILRTSDYTTYTPTQMALGRFVEGNINLVLAAGDHVFALNLEGVMQHGFPVVYDNAVFARHSYPRLVTFDNTDYVMLYDFRGGYFTIDEYAKYSSAYSYFWNTDDTDFWINNRKPDRMFYEYISQRLNFTYLDADNNLFLTYVSVPFDPVSSPIIWNGYRNEGSGFYYGTYHPVEDSLTFNAYLYPNPIRHGSARLHLSNMGTSANFRIYDITGKLLKKLVINKNDSDTQEALLDLHDLSSGVYLCVAESSHKIKRFKIAVEK